MQMDQHQRLGYEDAVLGVGIYKDLKTAGFLHDELNDLYGLFPMKLYRL